MPIIQIYTPKIREKRYSKPKKGDPKVIEGWKSINNLFLNFNEKSYFTL